jgi:hypothetical protein
MAGLGGFQAQFGQFPSQRVSVHPELFGRPGEVAAGLGQDPADEAALELAPTVFEVNAAFDHLVDQAIQQFLHGLLGRPQGLR